MIKLTSILVALLAMTLRVKAQTKTYFEGKITYKFDLISKSENIDAKTLKSVFGNGSTLMFKQGSFYHTYDGGIMEFDMYRKEDNKAYFKMRGNDTIFWSNCALAGDKIEKFVLTPKKETILGLNCDELKIQYHDRTESQYYNHGAISTNPGWFKRYLRDGENSIDEIEKSIYLRNKIDYSNFLLIETATKISRERIDEQSFQIPSSSILFEKK